MNQMRVKQLTMPKPSEFVPSKTVRGLERTNFKNYIDDKHAAMVMFYDPDCHHCHQSKPHFMKVAKTLSDRHRGFGTVDCSAEPELCKTEGVEAFPTFKLYVGGKYINTFSQPAHAPNMIKFVENAPKPMENPKPWPINPPDRSLYEDYKD